MTHDLLSLVALEAGFKTVLVAILYRSQMGMWHATLSSLAKILAQFLLMVMMGARQQAEMDHHIHVITFLL